MELIQLISGNIDAAWFMDVMVFIVIGIIAFLFKDIKNEIRDIKKVQHEQALDIVEIKTELFIKKRRKEEDE